MYYLQSRETGLFLDTDYESSRPWKSDPEKAGGKLTIASWGFMIQVFHLKDFDLIWIRENDGSRYYHVSRGIAMDAETRSEIDARIDDYWDNHPDVTGEEMMEYAEKLVREYFPRRD